MMKLPHTKVAVSVPELLSATNSFSVKRRPGCSASLLDSNPKQLFLRYNVKCKESYSDPAGHDVTIKFDVDKVEDTQNANDLDVQLNCSCSAFTYWSAAYNLHQRDGLLGDPISPDALKAPTKRLDLRANFILCVAPGTYIWMADGSEKLIEDIKVGDWVFTHRGRARQVTHVATRLPHDGEEAVVVSAKGAYEPLVVSTDHPLAVVRGNEVCLCGCKGVLPFYRGMKWERKYLLGHHQNRVARKLSQSDVFEIRSSSENNQVLAKKFGVSKASIIRTKSKVAHVDDLDLDDCSSGKLRWVEAGRLHSGSRESLYFPKLEWSGTKRIDPDLAALTGYYLAEGSIGYHKAGSKFEWKNKKSVTATIDGMRQNLYNVTFTLNIDEQDTLAKDISGRLRRWLGEDTPIHITHQSADGDEWLTVTVNHAQFAADMYRLGGMGSTTKRMAKEVWAWDLPAVKELVAAYALGDGHLDKEGEQYVYSTSRLLISQVSTILFSLGIWHGFLYQDWQGKKSVGKLKKNRYYRLYWNYQQYPQLLDLMVNRLRSHVLDRINSVKVRAQRANDCWNDGFLRCLYEVNKVPAPPIFYDLTIDEDESFIANRLVIHNCKHAKTVLERILPSVQNNIINIVREKKVKKYKEEHDEYQTSDKLRNEQEEMKRRLELKKIREIKNKDIQKKLLDALREKEEAGNVKPEEPGIVERDEVAVKAPTVTTPKKEDITQLEPEGEEDITGLLENEENRLLEEEHKKIKDEPHLHKGLPYEVEEEKTEHGHDVPSDEELMKVLKKEPEEDEDIQRRREQSRKRLKKLRDEKFQKWKRTRSSLEASLLDVVAGEDAHEF
jgi:hypothetical protein